MSKCAVSDKLDEFENDGNVSVNVCDVRWRLDDMKNYSESQEMFSDDDQPKDSSLRSPLVSRNNISTTPINLKTPVLFFKATEKTPGRAKIPKTPTSLAPFICKPNLVWTSDLETPKSKLNEENLVYDKTLDSIEIDNTTPVLQLTPESKEMMEVKKQQISSPVLGGKKRSKKKVKRRILNLNLDTDYINDRQDSVGSSSNKVPSETTSTTSNECLDIEQDHNDSIPNQEKTRSENESREKIQPEDNITNKKTSNTSTQDFFCNASFSSIDRLCSTVVLEKKPNPSIRAEKIKENINHEISETKEEDKTARFSDDILEKVTAIRRNQKPLKRYSEIVHSPIAKEVFSKTILELEQADQEFNKERKPIKEPLKPTSFLQLSSIKIDFDSKKNDINSAPFQDAVVVGTDSTMNINLNENQLMKEGNNKTSMDKISTNQSIEIENSCEKMDLSSKKTNDRPRKKLQLSLGIKNITPNIKSEDKITNSSTDNQSPELEILKLHENLELDQFLKPKISLKKMYPFDIKQANDAITKIDICSNFTSTYVTSEAQSTNFEDFGFTTAKGKSIQISDDQENHFQQIYNEMDDVDDDSLLNIKKNKKSKSNFLQKLSDKAAITFNNNNSNKGNKINEIHSVSKVKESHDSSSSFGESGFSTARGKGIQISEEKENLFQKIYNEMDNIDDDALLNIKKNKIKPVSFQTPKDKAVIVFNKKKIETNTISGTTIKTDSYDLFDTGFSTGRGKGIQISEEKENLFQQIYNEMDNVDDDALLNIKKNKIKPVSFQTPKDKAVIVFNKKKIETNTISGTTIKTDSYDLFDTGFSTGRGKDIQISEEKENLFKKYYSEIDDADENSLLNIKKNKKSMSNFLKKPTDKAVIQFNKKENKINTIPSNTVETEILKSCNIGFSTGRGKGIQINEEKENYYLKIYNNLDSETDEINFDNIRNKNRLPKLDTDERALAKSLVVVNNIENRLEIEHPEVLQSSKSVSSSTSDVTSTTLCNNSKSKIIGGQGTSTEGIDTLLDFGDLAEFFSPPHETQNLNCNNEKAHFLIPNSSHIIQKEQLLESIKGEVYDEKDDFKNNKDRAIIVATNILPLSVDINQQGKEVKNLVCSLKSKLNNCEVKRTERCRSFGGFPQTNQDMPATKLNKSDPADDNQPLLKGLSVSQCFDSHSDSWLSKLEISHLNGSKIKSPDVKKKKVESKFKKSSKEFFGFSFQECTESMRKYHKFGRFNRKQIPDFNNFTHISINPGKAISIFNPKLSPINIRIQGKLKKRKNENQYEIVESPKKQFRNEVPSKRHLLKSRYDMAVPQVSNKGVEKRKHADTDSDTPLTSVKKPRIGTELQGRKLFSDESDEEMENTMEDKNEEPVPLVQTPVELTPEEEEELSQQRMLALLKQEKIIKNKKKMKIKPSIGSLLKLRLANPTNRISWCEFVKDGVPVPRNNEQVKRTHLDAKILEVTASNATCFKFLSSSIVDNKRVVSIDIGDNAILIFDKEGRAGATEFTDALLAMPGVDPNLIPEGWVQNHYGWIIWKLASMDRIHFKCVNLPVMLTPERVMKELKYRYDREIDRAQRPALRRIIEKDDVASRRMALCVSSIKECVHTEESEKEARTLLGLSRWRVEVTDGWYNIPLTVDAAMANYISAGKIKEGTKIITYGAELLECERGFFPLEKPPNVSLKIHTNCTRRARWDTKLGYQKCSKPLPVKLKNIISNGGMIGEITAVAARVYPVLYREKTADGKSVYRNARSEEKAAIAHEKTIEIKLDAMYAEAQKNFDSKKKSDSDEDLESSQICSTKSQVRTRKVNHFERKQEEFKHKLESQMRESLPPKRDVTAVLKVRLVDENTTVILTIWGASEDSDCDIKEGDTITVYNSFASGSRQGDLNLTANRMTHIKTEPLLKLPYPKRFCTLIPNIGDLNFDPKYNEFDTVGLVVSSGAACYGMKNFEMANLAYPKSNNAGTAYMTVLFWNGIAAFGYQGLFTPGTLVACSNLEWRRNTAWCIAVAYCSEKTVFTSNPKQSHLVKELRNLKTLVQHPIQYAESCIEEVSAELAKKPQPRSNQATPTNLSFHNNNSLISPMDNYTPGNAMLHRRLEKLSRYGSSPEVSPIILNSNSARLKKDFTPVMRKDP